jgi:DNA-binding beta-propeller fold protein YncE
VARLKNPEGLALRGNTLFVANYGNGTVGKYDAKSGAAIKANFIAGLSQPFGVAVKSAR